MSDSGINTWNVWPDEQFTLSEFKAVPSYSSKWRAYDKIAVMLKDQNEHSAVLSHYICDEPENVGLSPLELERLNALVKVCDPTKPTMVTFSTGARFGKDIPDIVGLNYYPIGEQGQTVAGVADFIENTKSESGNKPIVFVVQAFSWESYGRSGTRWPTPKEVRAMSYLALVHNVKGLWYYEWPSPTMTSSTCLADTNPQLWQSLQSLFLEIKSIESGLLGPVTVPAYRINTIEPADVSPSFRLALSADRANAYLIAVWPYDSASARCQLDFTDSKIADCRISALSQTNSVICKKIGNSNYEFIFENMGSGIFKVNSSYLNQLIVIGTEAICGDVNHPYLTGDMNFDCRVDLDDLNMFYQNWMNCSLPECD